MKRATSNLTTRIAPRIRICKFLQQILHFRSESCSLVCYNVYIWRSARHGGRLPPFSAKIMKSSLSTTSQALLAAAVAFLFLPVVTQAQTSDAPPKLEKIDELESPATSPAPTQEDDPSQPVRRQIIETRERGEVTSIEVRGPRHSYYIDPGEQPGTVISGDAQSGTLRTPQWKIFEFDWKRSSETNNIDTQPAPAAPPAPPN
jgi:hypothetical protein